MPVATATANASTPTPTVTRHPSWSKPGPVGSWEELVHHQLRLRRMVELLTQGYSYRAVAKEMGLACTTVRRMAPEAARMSALADLPAPTSRPSMNDAEVAAEAEAT